MSMDNTDMWRATPAMPAAAQQWGPQGYTIIPIGQHGGTLQLAIALNKLDISLTDIAKLFGVSAQAVSISFKRHNVQRNRNIPRGGKPKLAPGQEDSLLLLLQKHENGRKDILEKFGIGASTLSALYRRAVQRVDPDKITDIKRLLMEKPGVSCDEVGKEVGLHGAVVALIKASGGKRQGAHRGIKRLSYEQETQILEQLGKGRARADVAQEFGIAMSTIRRTQLRAGARMSDEQQRVAKEMLQRTPPVQESAIAAYLNVPHIVIRQLAKAAGIPLQRISRRKELGAETL